MQWAAQQTDLLTEARRLGNITVMGDCRSDSPGTILCFSPLTIEMTMSSYIYSITFLPQRKLLKIGEWAKVKHVSN